MTVLVDVTAGGQLQLTVDGVTFPPLPVDAVQAAFDRLQDARNVSAKQQITAAAHALTDVLAGRPDSMSATFTVTSTAITATVDTATFDAVSAQLGLTPDDTGSLVYGPVTVTKSV